MFLRIEVYEIPEETNVGAGIRMAKIRTTYERLFSSCRVYTYTGSYLYRILLLQYYVYVYDCTYICENTCTILRATFLLQSTFKKHETRVHETVLLLYDEHEERSCSKKGKQLTFFSIQKPDWYYRTKY